MEVEKTVSPKRDSVDPNEVPVKVCPVFKWSEAGILWSLAADTPYWRPAVFELPPSAGVTADFALLRALATAGGMMDDTVA